MIGATSYRNSDSVTGVTNERALATLLSERRTSVLETRSDLVLERESPPSSNGWMLWLSSLQSRRDKRREEDRDGMER